MKDERTRLQAIEEQHGCVLPWDRLRQLQAWWASSEHRDDQATLYLEVSRDQVDALLEIELQLSTEPAMIADWEILSGHEQREVERFITLMSMDYEQFDEEDFAAFEAGQMPGLDPAHIRSLIVDLRVAYARQPWNRPLLINLHGWLQILRLPLWKGAHVRNAPTDD